MSSAPPTTARDVLAQDAAHTSPWTMCKECDRLTRKYEAQGMTTSDAQGTAEADHMRALGSLS